MFITNDVFRSPMSDLFGDAGCSYWPTVELGLQQMWFLMSVREAQQGDGEIFDITRTMFVSDFHYVEEFLEVYESKKEIRLKSLHVVTPEHINGTNGWAMDELAKVWAAQEPDEPTQNAMVFETKSGRRFTSSMLGTPVEAFSFDSLRFAAPS